MTYNDELERLARNAERVRSDLDQAVADSDAFRAAANPATILALLSANREMREALEFADKVLGANGFRDGSPVRLEIRSALTTQRGDGE